MTEDAAGGTVDCDVAVDKSWVASVGRGDRLVVLVRGDGITARSDERRHLASCTCSGGSPVLRHRAVVMLLVALVVLHVLRSVRSVHAGRLSGCRCSIAVRVDVLTSGSVRHVRGNGHAGELASGGRHHGVLVLGSEGLVGEVHALEAMSKGGHVGGIVVHAVCSSALAAAAVLVVVHGVGIAIAHVGTSVPVLTLVVVVGHGRHLCGGAVSIVALEYCGSEVLAWLPCLRPEEVLEPRAG